MTGGYIRTVPAKIEVLPEAGITAGLESVISTAELDTRPRRPPDYAAENRALVALAHQLTAAPEAILQGLAESALTLCRAHSAGISLVAEDGKTLYWPAIAGQFACHVGEGTPRDFGPCGTVMDRDSALLFSHPERHFPYLDIRPRIEEGLLIPFHVNGQPAGTIWVLSHDATCRFDAEDLRVMTSLSEFVATAYQLLASRNEMAHTHEELRQKSSALRESERRYRDMIDALPVAIYTTDPEGRLTHFNPAAVEFSGRIPDLGTDRWCVSWKLYRPDGSPMPHDECPMAIAINEGRIIRGVEMIVERPDGTRIWCTPYPGLLHDSQGRISGGINLLLDITARKQAEDALRRANEDLHRANSDLEQFAYSASHDLREPIRTVGMYSELVNRRYSQVLDANGKECLGFLTTAAKRMELLVKDLLAYTQIGKMPDGGDQECNAAAAFAGALSNLSESIEQSNAAISHDSLPKVAVREIELQQVFQNLIGNAIKYRRDGEIPVIHAAAEREGPMWRFSVRDNGIGIDPQYRETVFGLFKRLHVRDKYSGTGLGLAICQKIVERYGGRIWVESEAGTGSTFLFTIPAFGPEPASQR
ncbi:MAG TPA: ATP-binding protein [Bryobacteraceae bacterium]|nr:ATP-binding protein [Bryobacteraceae bacterium]